MNFFFLQLKSLNLTSKSTLNNQLKNFLLNISLLVHQMNFNVVETVTFFKKNYNFRKVLKVVFFLPRWLPRVYSTIGIHLYSTLWIGIRSRLSIHFWKRKYYSLEAQLKFFPNLDIPPNQKSSIILSKY